jgi:dTDP-glucose 4,6-dehydratase
MFASPKSNMIAANRGRALGGSRFRDRRINSHVQCADPRGAVAGHSAGRSAGEEFGGDCAHGHAVTQVLIGQHVSLKFSFETDLGPARTITLDQTWTECMTMPAADSYEDEHTGISILLAGPVCRGQQQDTIQNRSPVLSGRRTVARWSGGKESERLRVIITGGAGFLGSHLCDLFIDKGWDVLSLDNLVTGSEANISHLLGNPRFRFARHDVTRYIEVQGPVDVIMHFASPASPPDYLKIPIQTLKVGSLGTHNALGLALAKKAKFLMASTSECYGDPDVSPQPESYWGHVNPVGPRGVYDEAKRFSEAITMAYHRYHDVDTRIVRIFNTYGPRMRLNDGRALPNFLYQALVGEPLTVYGDGKQTRSFCYVSDLIDGIYRLLESNEHEPVNVGNPREITILEFAERVRALVGATAPIVFRPLPQDDPKQRCPDITKARRILKWEPKVDLEDGLRRTYEYFRNQVAAADSAH